MSGKEAYNNYEDEIDLYGDAEAPAEEQREQDRYGEEKRYRDDDNNDRGSGKNTSSIPTFISEARGGTGVLPPRDESGRSGSVGNSGGEQGSNGGSGGDGVLPRRGDYGSPGQWSTKPVSTVRPSDMPEEGKMFVGGLNWETTEEKMRKYFEQFGEVTHCTIMHDPQTGRSRGFGFLTFSNAAAVNSVMVKEHYLDGKIIDPKRAIPRPEVGAVTRQDKLFVRQIPQSMDYPKFKEYFSQFGGIVDSNLMIDRETGFHRGFGFVTYDDPAGAQNALSQAHYYDGQELEVKMATQKTRNQDTYVGDRPNRNRTYAPQGQGGMGGGQSQGQGGGYGGHMAGSSGGSGSGGGMGNMGAMGGMGGGMNPMAAAMGMGGMGGMGAMGGASGGGQQAFDPYAMSQFFKQMGWGNFNPMMLMQAGAMMSGGGQGGMMPGMMDPSAMMNMMAASSGGGMGMNMGGGNMGGMGGGGQFSPAGGFAGNSQAMRGASPQGEGSNSGDFARQPPKGPRAQQIQPGRSPVDTRPPPDAPKGPRNTGPGPMRGPPRGGAPRDHPYR